eukprot:Plantae.Rhodophyta-Hildenbrandia_rubra.ctg30402.p1 GENE.Plantae.Rhodophyta-Hildenbrandia_rubra.ctg30402~~Plantae.Rhodophyta-Hildenbrandia_rubra.ctg30402.p1  ORF type:complete len:262 (+),score=16.55 Plantae.Rhodophyta-Hildenbrandia_rubra.ctg30402:507-1292(+)
MQLIKEKLLPLYEAARLRVNYGSPYRKGRSPRGRRPQMRSIDLLGLALWRLKSRCRRREMCFLFGVAPTTLNMWLNCSLEALWRVVKRKSNADFEIEWPTVDQMKESAGLIERNRRYGAALRGALAVAGGGRMPCAERGDESMQNAYHEGCAGSVEVTNLIVFDFFGERIHSAVNYPGSWRDARLASVSGLCHDCLSDDLTPPGFAILGDSAFVNDLKVANWKALRGRKCNESDGMPEPAALAAIDLALQKAMPSERQSAE